MLTYQAFIQSPGDTFLNLGFLTIRWYGLLISISVVIGLFISKKLAKSRNINPQYISDILPSLIISSIIGARAYYVIFEWRQYSGNNFFTSFDLFNNVIQIPSFLAIWQGGIAIHGGLIGGFLCILFFCKSKNIHLKTFIDILIPSIILGQSIGRWGNFFNNEAFGIPTDLPWKLFIPIQNRPIEFINYQFFHPTFIYESLWNFFIFILLIIIFYQQNNKNSVRPGFISCLYLIGYSFGRFWIEGLRIDPLCIGGIPPFCDGGLRMAQFISIFLFSSGLIGIFFLRLKSYKNKTRNNG
ncbi:prolipoprotein diacylglyceryl transferase [uncultured Prochlorococcus sp.]|uniref:prolipoprotein diacylglyceryl transferase n=1 Tax=uncultured Prochlorococcus sp. TaxID=159733 RepID=UPI00258CD5DE|nr:prolipoprotein diacylglyceryl transferase [uncultured Prochlorococcus sp.]